MLPVLSPVFPDPDGLLETQPSSQAHLDLNVILYEQTENNFYRKAFEKGAKRKK